MSDRGSPRGGAQRHAAGGRVKSLPQTLTVIRPPQIGRNMPATRIPLLLVIQGAALCASLRVQPPSAARRETLPQSASRSALTAACAASLLFGAPQMPAGQPLGQSVVGAGEEATATARFTANDPMQRFSKLLVPPANADDAPAEGDNSPRLGPPHDLRELCLLGRQEE